MTSLRSEGAPGGQGGPGGVYCRLVEQEASNWDLEGAGAEPSVSSVRLPPVSRGPGPFKPASICLAALSLILLVAIIAVATHHKDTSGGEGEFQKQKQEANVTALTAAQSKLQQENANLVEEKARLVEERDRLVEEKARLVEERDRLGEEKARLVEERDRLVEEKARLVEEKARLVEERDRLVEEKARLVEEKARLVEERDRLVEEKARLVDKLANQTLTTVPPALTAPPSVACPEDWLRFRTSCYYLSRRSDDWSSSQTYCQRQGGHLAIVLTAEEQTFLWDLLPRGHWNAYWIGVSDAHTEDEWKWVDGTTLIGGFWEDGEPNNHIDEDCGYIVKTRKLERVALKSWYDAPCGMARAFICEREM